MTHFWCWRPARSALAMASLLVAGCAATPHDPQALPNSHVPLRLAQIGYGRDATFESCRADACPQRTQKTLPVPPVQQTQGPAMPTTSLDDAVSHDSASHRPTARTQQPRENRVSGQLDIQFAFSSAQLSAVALQTLRDLAPRLVHAKQVRISGRTDSTGPVLTNERLAKARADAVLRELLILSPSIAPIASVEAQGTCCYAQSNGSPAGRARNRRVEIRYEVNSNAPP